MCRSCEFHESRDSGQPLPPIVQTPRLLLRLLTAGDAGFILELVNEPAWLRFIGDRHVHTCAAAENYIGQCLAMHRQHGVGLLAVERVDRSAVIGICGLLKRDPRAEIDLGFAFLERFRGQGFAREAASAMLEFGHTSLQLDRIIAYTHPENDASITLLKKLGFAFERAIPREDGTTQSLLLAHFRADRQSGVSG